MNRNLLSDWTPSDFETVENGVLLARHRLVETGLFTDEALARVLDSHPADCLHINTMGDDTNKFEWREGDRGGVPGDVLLETVRKGHLWINCRNMLDHQPEYAKAIHEIYDDIELKNTGFRAEDRSANLLISSPGALVHYHVDLPVNMLWHLRGSKRVWVYPHFDSRFVAQSCMEMVCSGEFTDDVPYDPDFDKYALVFDVQPGELITWPQHTPHRVTNLEGLNVSLSTEHKNPRARRRINVHLANQFLRRQFGIATPHVEVDGASAHLKQTLSRALRYWSKLRGIEKEQFTYPISFVVDPSAPHGVRLLDVPNEVLDAPHLSEQFAVGSAS